MIYVSDQTATGDKKFSLIAYSPGGQLFPLWSLMLHEAVRLCLGPQKYMTIV